MASEAATTSTTSLQLADGRSFLVATPAKSLLLTAATRAARDEWLEAFAGAFKALHAKSDRLQHGNVIPAFA